MEKIMNRDFDLDAYYEKAFSGEVCHDESIIPYIKSFSQVVLWGASFQGKAIGKKLLECGVDISTYWDIRWEEIGTVNELAVIEPFTTDRSDETLVIICIGNRVIHKRLTVNLEKHGYLHHIPGDYLYMGLLCPFSAETGVNARRCSGTMECRQIYCHRIEGIMERQSGVDNPFFLPSITLVINQICSLKCKYCTSYMNEYAPSERINFPLEQIKSDIDKFMGAVDGVGTITVMGGEPFLHPNISEIIEHLCKWKNFGLISIATSGTCRIKPKQLEGLHDPRVNVSFSNYSLSISEKQNELFKNSIETVKRSGVAYTVGLFSPEWIVPPELDKKDMSDEEARQRKTECTRWHQIKNGKVHPCDFAQSLYSLHIADYPTDYVDLEAYDSKEEIRAALIEYGNRGFYESCKHHKRGAKQKLLTAMAAEQGYVNMRGAIMLQ